MSSIRSANHQGQVAICAQLLQQVEEVARHRNVAPRCVTMIGTEYVPASYCDEHRVADCDPREIGIITVGEILKGSPKILIRIRVGATQHFTAGMMMHFDVVR